MVHYGQMPPSLASEVVLHFDKAVNEALSNRVRKQGRGKWRYGKHCNFCLSVQVRNKVIFHSEKLSTYRFCDNVWTFILKV